MNSLKIQELKTYLTHASELVQRTAINHEDIDLADLIKAMSSIEYCRGILFDEAIDNGEEEND